MSGSGQEALPNVWEWSGGPPRCPGVVGSPSRMVWSCREDLLVVPEWLGVPPGYPGVVGMPTQMTRSGRKAFPDIR